MGFRLWVWLPLQLLYYIVSPNSRLSKNISVLSSKYVMIPVFKYLCDYWCSLIYCTPVKTVGEGFQKINVTFSTFSLSITINAVWRRKFKYFELKESRVNINRSISADEIADRSLKLGIMNYHERYLVSYEKLLVNETVFIIFEELILPELIVKYKLLSRLVLRVNISVMKTLKTLHCLETDVSFSQR